MAKTPRMIPHERILSRFFETLILLNVLGRDTGPHVTVEHNPSSHVAARHRFLKNLAFICDYIKGGKTTTSIGVEDNPDNYRFWFASNQDAGADVAAFLDSVLAMLQRTSALPGSQRVEHEDEVAKMCTAFAIPRIKKEAKLLSNACKKCIAYLGAGMSQRLCRNRGFVALLTDPDNRLATWLKLFIWDSKVQTLFPLCCIAYDNRNAPEMSEVETLARDPDDGSNTGDITECFRRVRHFIGRLSSHIRVPKQLVEDSPRMQTLLDVYSVGKVPALLSVPSPKADGHTNLESILGRMLPKDDVRLPRLLQSLLTIDRSRGLQADVLAKYEEPLIPCVHCEIQVHEHFHSKQLKFFVDDRYIASSKPACLCCKLYFRHHPARCVEPDSHEKAHLHWGPPLLQNTNTDSSEFKQYRKLLVSIINGLNQVVLEKIANPHGTVFSHPDSVTGITQSVNGDWYVDSDSEMGFGLETSDSDVDATPGLTDTTDEEEDSHEPDEGFFDYCESDSDGGVAL